MIAVGLVEPRLTEGRRILLGKIVGLHGVDGTVKLESYAQPRVGIFKYTPWLLKMQSQELEVANVRGREQGKGLVAKLPGVDSRDRAAAWMGAEIWVWRSALPRSKQEEYYWCDLEGLEVVTASGTVLGRIAHLFATGANDVMVVRGVEREHLVPFVLGSYVQKVDLDSGRITVDWDPDF